MAPIDPNQLLAAFSPLLTTFGGIKNAAEVPRLSSLMKKFSRKLVSRCVYCNVLLSTTPDVLEEFLRFGGWETIHLWIKSAKELGNKPFLEELLKLLLMLPMNVERLRENDSPKIINKLSKSDDIVLSSKAKLVVDQWTKMIEKAAGTEKKDNKDHNHKDHKRKRKKDSIDSTSNDSKDSNDVKKTKINVKIDINSVDYNSNDSSLSMDSLIKEENKVTIERTPRPVTAKVKPGKSRLDALVNSNAKTNPKPKRIKGDITQSINNKKLNHIKSSTSSGNEETKPNLKDLATSSSAKPKSPVEVKPNISLTTTPTTTPPTPSVKHVLQDSTSFMDALIAEPTAKKKRRSSGPLLKDNNSDKTSISSPKASLPKTFSFYKDIIDEKVVDQQNNDSDNVFNDDNEDYSNDNNDSNNESVSEEPNDESNHSNLNEEEINVNIIVPDIIDTPVLQKSPSIKTKPILTYVKKGIKKNVRWVEDSKLQSVKFFELDETERVNVTRPPGSGSFSDLKRSDMRHEAEMFMARKSHHFDISDDYQSRVQTFSPWKLIPCDSQSNLIESGKESNEKFIQLERMKTTLESFYTRNQIPDSPQEPELEINSEVLETKIIPLEDDNNPNNTHDFSNIDLPQPKTGEHLPSRIPDFKPSTPQMNNFTRIPGPFASTGGQPLLPVAPNFSGVPSMMPQFGAPHMPAPDHYSVRPSNVQQFYPPSGGSMQQPMQQWSDSCPPPHPPPPHFIPPFPNQIPQARGGGPMGVRPPRLPRNAQNTVCRHFARTGKCRFQPRCNFLHSNDKI